MVVIIIGTCIQKCCGLPLADCSVMTAHDLSDDKGYRRHGLGIRRSSFGADRCAPLFLCALSLAQVPASLRSFPPALFPCLFLLLPLSG